MAWWQQQLLDGIAQALEDETTIDLVFGTLMLQVPNYNRQEGNMGDPSKVIDWMLLKSAKLAIAELCEIILQNIQFTTIGSFVINIKCVTHCSFASWITFVHTTIVLYKREMHVVLSNWTPSKMHMRNAHACIWPSC